VRERRFDLAVVRVVGAARGQLVALVLGEAFVLGLVGAGVGAVLGVTVGWVLVTIVNVQSHGWSLVFEPPLAPVVWTALAVVPACVLAGLAPALGALARAPREVLRETG
jgi:putative ABC transport system permease protein